MLTARSTKWYIVNDQMVNELIFDILDYRKKKKMCRIICTCQNFIVPLRRILSRKEELCPRKKKRLRKSAKLC